MPRDTKKVALMTGASGGIGRECALLAAERGFDLCLHYNSKPGAAEAVAADCRELGAACMTVGADLCDAVAVAALFDLFDARFPRLDVLINNAGMIGAKTSLLDLSPDVLQRTFAVNTFGTVYCLQNAIPRMSTKCGRPGGVVVNVSSIAATLGSPGEYVHYASSKAAIDALTLGAAKELGPEGIRVNAVQAGTADTEIHASVGNRSRLEAVAQANPLGRVAEPREIAQAILWLASEEALYANGAILRVSGGI